MRRAFTMIELIFIIAILGIIATIAIPKLISVRDDAKIANSLNELQTAITDISSFYTSQAKLGTIHQMTSIDEFDALNIDVSVGRTVNFLTEARGGDEACVAFIFTSDGTLTVQGNTHVTGSVCKEIKKSSSFKAMEKKYNLGGTRIAH